MSLYRTDQDMASMNPVICEAHGVISRTKIVQHPRVANRSTAYYRVHIAYCTITRTGIRNRLLGRFWYAHRCSVNHMRILCGSRRHNFCQDGLTLRKHASEASTIVVSDPAQGLRPRNSGPDISAQHTHGTVGWNMLQITFATMPLQWSRRPLRHPVVLSGMEETGEPKKS